MKLGFRAVVAILLAIMGMEFVAEKLDVSTALAEPMKRTERSGANGIGQ